jgi:hypothetical protein
MPFPAAHQTPLAWVAGNFFPDIIIVIMRVVSPTTWRRRRATTLIIPSH